MTAEHQGAARLAAALGAPPPDAIAQLSDAEQDRLATLIETALRRQHTAIEAAFEATVRHVPFPARRLVRKALFG